MTSVCGDKSLKFEFLSLNIDGFSDLLSFGSKGGEVYVRESSSHHEL